MWQSFFLVIPIIFRYLLGTILTIVAGALAIKLVQNLFFEGEALKIQDAVIGIDNRHGKIFAATSLLKTDLDWEDCQVQILEFAEQTSLVENIHVSSGWVFAYSGDDLVSMFCHDNYLDLNFSSVDSRRPFILRERFNEELREKNSNFLPQSD